MCRLHHENAGLDEAQTAVKISGRNINHLRYADDTTLIAENEEELKNLLMKVKEESEKVGLKLNIQKMKIMASGPITSWQIDGETVETVVDQSILKESVLNIHEKDWCWSFNTLATWCEELCHWKSQRAPEKASISALLTMPKPQTVWITTNCGKFWKRWEYQTTWPASWETYMHVRKQQLELDIDQQTGSK